MTFAAVVLAGWALWQNDLQAAILSGALIVGRSVRGPSGWWRSRVDAARRLRATREDVR